MDELKYRDEFSLALECLKSDKSIIIDSITKVALHYKQFAPLTVNLILSRSRTSRTAEESYYLMLLMLHILTVSDDTSFYLQCEKNNEFVEIFLMNYKDFPVIQSRMKDLINKSLLSGIASTLTRSIHERIKIVDKETEVAARKKLRALPILHAKEPALREPQRKVLDLFYDRENYTKSSKKEYKKCRDWYLKKDEEIDTVTDLQPEMIPADQGLPTPCKLCKLDIKPEYIRVLNSWCYKDVKQSGKDIYHFKCFLSTINKPSQKTKIEAGATFSSVNLPHCASRTCFLDGNNVCSWLVKSDKSQIDIISASLIEPSSTTTTLDLSSLVPLSSIHQVYSIIITKSHFIVNLWTKSGFPIIKISKSNLSEVSFVCNGPAILYNKIHDDCFFYFQRNDMQLFKYSEAIGSQLIDTAGLINGEPLDLAIDKDNKIWLISEEETQCIDPRLNSDDPEYCISAFPVGLERPNCVYINNGEVQGLLAYETAANIDSTSKKFAFLDILNVDLIDLIADDSYTALKPPQSLIIYDGKLLAWADNEWLACQIPDKVPLQ